MHAWYLLFFLHGEIIPRHFLILLFKQAADFFSIVNLPLYIVCLKPFLDKMSWGNNGELLLVKSNAEDGTEIRATRTLQGKHLIMVSIPNDTVNFIPRKQLIDMIHHTPECFAIYDGKLI